MPFVLPSKREVGSLSPEIAGEGQKVIMSDGELITWNPPPPKPVMPDWSEIKSIRHYFNRTGFRVWPAWLYHPTDDARIVKNADEAAELGVCYREASIDEKGRYGLDHVWDWKDDSQWRPTPYPGTTKYNPNRIEQGKNYVPTAPNPVHAQHDLAALLIPQVAAAVAAALKSTGPAAPAKVDPAQWDAFLEFQAWQKTREAVDVLTEPEAAADTGQEEPAEPQQPNPLAALTPEQDRALWLEEAARKGIKIDKRWSLERIKTEVQKAAAA